MYLFHFLLMIYCFKKDMQNPEPRSQQSSRGGLFLIIYHVYVCVSNPFLSRNN